MKMLQLYFLFLVFSAGSVCLFLIITTNYPYIIRGHHDVRRISAVRDKDTVLFKSKPTTHKDPTSRWGSPKKTNTNAKAIGTDSERKSAAVVKFATATSSDKSEGNKSSQKRTDREVNKTATHKSQKEAKDVVGSLNVSINTTAHNSSDKWVVFVCNNRRSCGGWGDRQRGLVGVYLLALVTGRRFGLIMTRPCPITHHYVPNIVPWDVAPETLKAAGQGSNISLDDMGSRLRITARLRVMDFNAVYPQRVVYIRTNGDYLISLRVSKLYTPVLPAWAQGTRNSIFVAAWIRLMKPSPSLQAALDAFLDKIHFRQRTHPLVCAHVRVGRSATLKHDSAVRCNITTLPVLWNFLQRWVNNGSNIFLATDSYEARNLTRHRFGSRMFDTDQNIVHVDQAGSVAHACHGFQSALLDQLILSRCDVLVTSHSMFGHMASRLRGHSDNLFSFLKGAIRTQFL